MLLQAFLIYKLADFSSAFKFIVVNKMCHKVFSVHACTCTCVNEVCRCIIVCHQAHERSVQFLRLIHQAIFENISKHKHNCFAVLTFAQNERHRTFFKVHGSRYVSPTTAPLAMASPEFLPQKKKRKRKCWHSDVPPLEMSRFFTRSCFHSCVHCGLFKWDWLCGLKRENLGRPKQKQLLRHPRNNNQGGRTQGLKRRRRRSRKSRGRRGASAGAKCSRRFINASCSQCIMNALDGILIDQTSITNTLECQNEKKTKQKQPHCVH